MAENTEKKEQVSFKLNFNYSILDAEGFEIETIRGGIKAGTPITNDMYEPLKANKLLGRTISLSNEELAGKSFEWYSQLLTTGVITLDKVDTGILKAFIENQRKEKNANFNNVVVHQLLLTLKGAGYND